MKDIQLFILFLIQIQFGYSQSEKIINGKVFYEQSPVQGIEIVNLITNKKTITDINGNFSILVKPDDILTFTSEKYEKNRLVIERKVLEENNVIVLLLRKPEELEEIVVMKINAPKIKFDRSSLDQIGLERAAKTPKIVGIYDGRIENGADINRILGMFWGLFVKNQEKAVEVQIDFKDLIKHKFEEDFFIKELKLNTSEINLFIEFCDADPKSKILFENTNLLILMDFLFVKNNEFKKLPQK